jgi:regulator of RNase E activity RraA
VGGLVVYPDDLLHGDLNGITTIPREIASEVPEVAREYIEAESIVLEALQAPGPSVKAYEEALREAQGRFATLRGRLSRKT